MDGLTCTEIVVKSWRVYTRKSNTSVRWKQRQPSLYILWNCFIALAKNTKYFTRCYADLARSVRSDWKVGSFASSSIYKICRMRQAETFVIGNEKVHTSSSAEIQFCYRATIYSDILPLENGSYTNQKEKRGKFIFRLFLPRSLSLCQNVLSLKKITHNKYL